MGQGQINPLVLYAYRVFPLQVTVYIENPDFFIFFSKSVFTYEKLIFFLPHSLFTYKIQNSAMVLQPSSPLGLMLLCRDSGLKPFVNHFEAVSPQCVLRPFHGAHVIC